ncbi:hypothetical protein Peetri_00224 [Pseudomonas phage vB_PpuM-Peetri]
MIGNGEGFKVSQEMLDIAADYKSHMLVSTLEWERSKWTELRYEFLKAQAKFEGEALLGGPVGARVHRDSNFWYELTMRIPAAHPGETIDDAIDLWLETLLDILRPGK